MGLTTPGSERRSNIFPGREVIYKFNMFGLVKHFSRLGGHILGSKVQYGQLFSQAQGGKTFSKRGRIEKSRKGRANIFPSWMVTDQKFYQEGNFRIIVTHVSVSQ